MRRRKFHAAAAKGRGARVGLVRRLPVEARMGALTIEEVEIPAQRSARLGDGGVGLEVDLLVLHQSPQPLDEHIVAPGAFWIVSLDVV